MTQKRSNAVVVHMGIRKLKQESNSSLPSLSKAKLEALIEEAVVMLTVTRNGLLASLR